MDKNLDEYFISSSTGRTRDKKKHEIHLQTLVEGYAAALVHIVDWEARVSLTTLDIQEVNEFANFLEEKFDKDYVQDLTYDDVKKLVSNFLLSRKDRESEAMDKIYYHTAKYVMLETNDMEKFESWLKSTMQKTGMLKIS